MLKHRINSNFNVIMVRDESSLEFIAKITAIHPGVDTFQSGWADPSIDQPSDQPTLPSLEPSCHLC